MKLKIENGLCIRICKEDRQEFSATIDEANVRAILHTPKLASKDRIRQEVEKRAKWYTRQMDKIMHRESFLQDVVEQKCYLLFGERYTPIVSDVEKVCLKDGKLLVPKVDKKGLENQMVLWYIGQAFDYLLKAHRQLSKIYNIRNGGVRMGNNKTQWASVSAKGVISLNWRLVFLPKDTIDYVLAVTLVKCKYGKLCGQLWEEVDKMTVNYKEQRAIFKLHQGLVNLFRNKEVPLSERQYFDNLKNTLF